MSEMPLFDRLDERGDEGGERVFRVGEISRAVRLTVEDRWANVLIEGEVSNVRRAASGHVYFTLNDEEEPAQLAGVMFRSDAVRTRHPLEDGARMRFRGQLSIYVGRSQFQLIARWATPVGEGDLAARFRRIHAKLEAEGLFDPARKRPLPMLPNVVGVVTSVSGAAIRDIVRVSANRCPVRIVVADCRVQGEEAPATIVAALTSIQGLADLDVVILGRGGGSAEDLFAFNDERVARAVAQCRVPVVTGIGHEIDLTIADLVADARASTPSNAAELVVPERRVLRGTLDALERHLQRAMAAALDRSRLRLERHLRPLQASGRLVDEGRKQLSRLHGRLAARDPRLLLREDRRALTDWVTRLRDAGRRPLATGRRDLATASARLHGYGRPMVAAARAKHAALCAQLDALSPLRVLERGYAIALRADTNAAIRSTSEVSDGDRIRVRVQDGDFPAKVGDDE